MWTWTCELVVNPQSNAQWTTFVLSPVDSAFVVPGLSPNWLSDKASNPE